MDKNMKENLSLGSRFDVIIVGGGLAGLQAAKTICQLRPDWSVVLLEADNRLGGRVKSVEGIAPWPIEVGAEFLHGAHHSSIKRMVDQMGCTQRELPYPDRYYLGDNRLLTESEADEHPGIVRVHRWFADMHELEWEGEDVSVEMYLRGKGASDEEIQLAEAIYANDFGCSLPSLGLLESVSECGQWVYGDSYFILDRPLAKVVERLAKGTQVRLGCHVSSIEMSEGGGVRVRGKGGEEVTAEKVIITVPLAILKQGDIEFVPPLPESKRKAIRSLGMANAVKVILCFSHPFWHQDIFDVVCSASFLPEIWITSYPPTTRNPNNPDQSSTLPHPPFHTCICHKRKNRPRIPGGDHGFDTTLGSHVITGFAAGDQANFIASLPIQIIVEQALAQLDEMFGSSSSGVLNTQVEMNDESIESISLDVKKESNDVHDYEKKGFGEEECKKRGAGAEERDIVNDSQPFNTENTGQSLCGSCFRTRLGISGEINRRKAPASHHFTSAYLHDWAKEPFVGGAYSHPSIGGLGERVRLAEPIDGRLFFAGEATHPGVNPCMQAALDTGERVGKEVVQFSNSDRVV